MDCVLFDFFRVVFLLHLFHSHKLQIQVVNQRPNLLVCLRGEVLRHGGEGGIGPGIGRAVPADEPVGNVDVVGPVQLGAVLLEEVGHFDAQLREFGGLLAFYQCNRLLREERQQVFAEEAFEDDGVEEGGEEAGEVRRTVGP